MLSGVATRYDERMRVPALVVLAAGCGFSLQPAGGIDSAPGDDAPPPIDAAFDASPVDGPLVIDAALIDAPMVTACTVSPSGATTTIPGVGGTGGLNQGMLGCPVGELPVGIQFDVTPAPIVNHANQTLIVHIRVRCGRVTRTTSSVMTTSPQGQAEHLGLDGSSPTACDAYVPPTVTQEVSCPAGQVLTGIRGNQVDTTLYNTVSVRCTTLAANGTVTGSHTVLVVNGTGSYNNAIETSNCPAGTAIISLTARSGCGQDSVTPSCAPLSCQ